MHWYFVYFYISNTQINGFRSLLCLYYLAYIIRAPTIILMLFNLIEPYLTRSLPPWSQSLTSCKIMCLQFWNSTATRSRV